jgi:TatD DNase family protein
MWIDTHCHPFSSPFDEDRDEMLERARAAGVSKMLVVGYRDWANKEALKMAAENEDMWCAIGVHPCDCEEWTQEMQDWIREQVKKDRTQVAGLEGAVENSRFERKIVGIGEMGMDYHHMKSTKEVQEKVFREQIRLAKELDLPCIVHSRDAAEDTLRILLDEQAEKVIFHCYSYGLDYGKRVWEAGYYTSFSGVVTYPNAKDVQEAVKGAPEDLILIETDCPYLTPQSMRGKRNEIACVVEVGEKVAELRGISNGELAQIAMRNAEWVFGLE